LPRADFCDSDSFFENERQVKVEQSRMADHHKHRLEVEAVRRVLKTLVLGTPVLGTPVLKTLGQLLTEACREADNPIRLG
jgi:hypothetical protein